MVKIEPSDFSCNENIIQLLETTYCPTNVHKQSLHETIETCEKTISEFDSKIVESKRHLKSLEKARAAAEKNLKNARSLLAPIRRMPEEILSMILCLVSSSEKREDHAHHRAVRTISPPPSPLIFLRVCKLWRRVVLNTPRLF
ncbi:hypothetical protein M422DRAFT_191077, partial [Sphaerobolus stellatus SS14]